MSEQKPLHYGKEIFDNAAEGNDLLITMVLESLEQSSIPPTPIFRWFAMNILYKFMQFEEVYLNSEDQSEETRKSQEADLTGMVEALTMAMGVADKQKMFSLAEELRSALTRRKLRFPPTMDMTYGGLLP